jgi:hypothetical protein
MHACAMGELDRDYLSRSSVLQLIPVSFSIILTVHAERQQLPVHLHPHATPSGILFTPHPPLLPVPLLLGHRYL